MGRSGSSVHNTGSSDESLAFDSFEAGLDAAWGQRSLAMRPIGAAPLPKVEGVGWYFRLQLGASIGSCNCAFGIGVSLGLGSAGRRWVAGYWGRSGRQRIHEEMECYFEWHPHGLREGDEVAFLVNLKGRCFVFINGQECCQFADPPVPVTATDEVELSALVDSSAPVTFLGNSPLPSCLASGQEVQDRGTELLHHRPAAASCAWGAT